MPAQESGNGEKGKAKGPMQTLEGVCEYSHSDVLPFPLFQAVWGHHWMFYTTREDRGEGVWSLIWRYLCCFASHTPPGLWWSEPFFKQSKIKNVNIPLGAATSIFLSWGWSCTARNWWCHPVGSLGNARGWAQPEPCSGEMVLWPHPWTGLGVLLWTWYLLWVCWACERHQTCLSGAEAISVPWPLDGPAAPDSSAGHHSDGRGAGLDGAEVSAASGAHSPHHRWPQVFQVSSKEEEQKEQGPWWAKCVVHLLGAQAGIVCWLVQTQV